MLDKSDIDDLFSFMVDYHDLHPDGEFFDYYVLPESLAVWLVFVNRDGVFYEFTGDDGVQPTFGRRDVPLRNARRLIGRQRRRRNA